MAAILSLGLALGPAGVQAAPALPTVPPSQPASPESGAPVEAAPEGDEAQSPEGDAAPEPETALEPERAEPAIAEPEADRDAAGEAEPADRGEGEDEAEAKADDEAEADDDAEADDTEAPGAPGPTAAPLRPIQTAAWWTMFGAFALGTTAGVLAGLAERQEDRATRLSTLFDVETGAQPLYADRKDEYERYLRRGEGYAKAALGVGVVAGAATLAAITLFAIDAARQRKGAAPERKRRASWNVRGGGMEVRF